MRRRDKMLSCNETSSQNPSSPALPSMTNESLFYYYCCQFWNFQFNFLPLHFCPHISPHTCDTFLRGKEKDFHFQLMCHFTPSSIYENTIQSPGITPFRLRNLDEICFLPQSCWNICYKFRHDSILDEFHFYSS